MAKYQVKLIMSEEYTINAKSKKDAEKEARADFGNDYLIDYVAVTESKHCCALTDKIKQHIKTWLIRMYMKLQ